MRRNNGYLAAQLVYDRQEPPEFEAWECPVCGELFFRDDKLYLDSDGEVVGCGYCARAVTAEEYFGGEDG